MSTPDVSDRRPFPGCLLGLAVQLGAVALGLGVLGCGSALGALTTPVTGPFGPLAGLVCFAAAAPVIGLAAGLWLRRRITAPLDRAFADLDPTPRRFLLSGRAWLGTHAGREVQVTLLKGPIVQVTMACDARARLAVGAPTALSAGVAGLAGLSTVPVPGGALAAYAADAEWAAGLLTDEPAVAALSRLLLDDDLAPQRILNVEADCVLFTLRRPRAAPGPAESASWLDDLAVVAAAVESRPLPARPVTPGRALRPAPLRVAPRPG